jgi:hypothetical protein
MKIRYSLFILLFGLFFSLSNCFAVNVDSSLQTGNDYFEEGLKSTSLLERKSLFNKALTVFLPAESTAPSASLFGAIGDCLYQLAEYPLSILYYNRALQLEPRNAQVRNHLILAQSALGLPLVSETTPLFGSYLSDSERLKIVFFAAILLFISLSMSIWFRGAIWKSLSLLAVCLNLILSVYLIACFYLTPVEAVLMNFGGLYRQPDFNEPQLAYDPLMKGLKVKVLESDRSGLWLKIETPQNKIGYVPFYSARFIVVTP